MSELEELTPEQKKALIWLAGVLERMNGWCAVNKWIGKTILITGLTALILFSNAIDAFKHLLGIK